jgi:NAD(P)-dependent dehydrogenase (short-subunit alcohol dehydrogenase family)
MARRGRHSVAVYGATGHTGRFVVAELLRRGLVPIAVARDAAKLAVSDFGARGVATRAASVDDPASLDHALTDVAAVINCAGPFLDTATAVGEAALRAGIHYLDVTAEQPSAQATFERFADGARAVGVVVVPAMGFYGGLADLLATAAIGTWDFADEIEVAVGLDSWHPTLGTRITGHRYTAQRQMVADGRLQPLPQSARETAWDFAEPIGRQDVVELPLSETVLITQHLRVSHLHSYINQAPLKDLLDPTTPPPRPSDERGRSPQMFALEVVVRTDRDERRALARGRDIYAVTAPLVCEAVQRVVDGSVQPCGAFAPGEIFDAESFLQALSPEHLTFSLEAVRHTTTAS